MRSLAAAAFIFVIGLIVVGAAAGGPSRPVGAQANQAHPLLLQTQGPQMRLPVLQIARHSETTNATVPSARAFVESSRARALFSSGRNEQRPAIRQQFKTPQSFEQNRLQDNSGNPAQGDSIVGALQVPKHLLAMPSSIHASKVVEPQHQRGYFVRGPSMTSRFAALNLSLYDPLKSATIRNTLARPHLKAASFVQPHVFAQPIEQPTSGPSPQPGPSSKPSGSGTGLNHWWTYQEDRIPGVGAYLVNLGSGDLLVQADDMVAQNKGISFTFRRTYNSSSQHDVNGTDGSIASNYGNGWTNTFDVHLGYVAQTNALLVYDLDGAKYHYGPEGVGACWNKPTGLYATLCWDGQHGYYWTKPNGSRYHFYSPNDPAVPAGLSGRLYDIEARNRNNYLSFAYAFTSQSNPTVANLTSIVVTSEDGRQATLSFTPQSPASLLQNLEWPDGTTVSYEYDASGDLTEVDHPANNSNGVISSEQYGWYSGGYYLYWIASPRWVNSFNGSTATDGMYDAFGYSSAGDITEVQYIGEVNPQVPDGYSTTPIQGSSYSASPYLFKTTTYTYPSNPISIGCQSSSTGATQYADTDGHQISYCLDSKQRVNEVISSTGDASPGPPTLTTLQAWDSSNNNISSTDPRGNETDYAYDSSGNVIAIARPAPTAGAPRPTSYFSYDTSQNLTAYCDPYEVNQSNDNWQSTPAPSDSLCSSPAVGAFTSYTWAAPADGSEPNGQLQTIQKPSGYQTRFSYSSAQQGGLDYGLPTKEIAASGFTEANGVQVTPEVDYTYDNAGDAICISRAIGTGLYATWIAEFDSMGREIKRADPDDDPTQSHISQASCSKTAGIPNSTIVWSTQYYPNGSIMSMQDPAESAAAVTQSLTYDLDDDQTTDLTHNDGVAGTTKRFYDGYDRLIEVAEPYDTRNIGVPGLYWHTATIDRYSVPWLTRYLYDLTQDGADGSLSLSGGSNFTAHGHLYKTQEYLPIGGAPTWVDTKGSAYDAADRTTDYIAYSPGSCNGATCGGTPENTTVTYDGPGEAGLMTITNNPDGSYNSYTYDNLGRATGKSESGSTFSYQYDADGRIQLYSQNLGTDSNTLAEQYTPDGDLESSTESYSIQGCVFTLSCFVLPTVTTDSYYPNGWRSAESVATAANPNTPLFNSNYSYRADGLRTQLGFTYNSNTSYFGWAYTSAGRMTSKSDPYLNPSFTYGYDSYGREDQSTVPGGGSFGSYTYEPEGRVREYAVNPFGHPLVYQYSVRGELAAEYQPVVDGFERYEQFANGYALGGFDSCFNAPPFSCVFDTGSSKTYDERDAVTDAIGFPNSPPGGIAYAFDSAGRQNATTVSWYIGKGQTQESGTVSKAYDSENRLLSESQGTLLRHYNPTACSHDHLNYDYGPSGRLTLVNNLPNTPEIYDTIHWANGAILFTNNSSGQVDDIKIEDLGDIAPLDAHYTGLVVWDRNDSGEVDGAHTSSGIESARLVDYSAGGSRTQFDGFQYGNIWFPSIQMFSDRSDGYDDGCNVFQGNRTYDTLMEDWTTPDIYPGLIEDPESGKGYVWNRGNPIDFQDPSGFCPWASAVIPCNPALDSPPPSAAKVRAQLMMQADPVIGGWVIINGALDLAGLEFPEEKAIQAAYQVGADYLRKQGEKEAVIILGHAPDYVNKAKELGGKILDMATNVWRGYTHDEQGAIIKGFIDTAIADGDTIRTVGNPIRVGGEMDTWSGAEIRYLESLGYVPIYDAATDTYIWVKPAK